MNEIADKKERFHFLDGLRGIAALMIVVHHAFTAHIIKLVSTLKIRFFTDFFTYFTQSGVELFFVLSGVVLLRPYLRNQKTFKTGDYFLRRIKRIYPPYFFAMLFGALVVWLNNKFPTWYNEDGLRAQFSWWETVKEVAIFNFDGKYYNLAWWSLQIEVLFYVLVPVIVLVYPKRDKVNGWKLVGSIVAAIFIIFTLQNLFTEYCSGIYAYTYQVATLGKFVEYMLCFLLGLFLAKTDFTLKQGYYFLSSGVMLVVVSLLLFRQAPDMLAGHYLGYELVQNGVKQPAWIYLSFMHSGYGLFYAGVIILAFRLDTFKRVLSQPIMIWLGERSYSLFLIHFSVFYLVDNLISHITPERTAAYGILTRGLGIPVALFAAMVLFTFVERRQARGLVTGDMFWPWEVKRLKSW